MDTNIYYDSVGKGLWITSNFAEWQKKMDLGIFPRTGYKEVAVFQLDELEFDKVSIDKIENLYFKDIKDILSKYRFEIIAFHNSNIDLSNSVFNVKHLIIGDNSKINLKKENFKNLLEITFLSVRTFKGRILDKFNGVEKLILWYENKKSNDILSLFPDLTEFFIYNGTLTELNLIENQFIERLQLHGCTKLEKVILTEGDKLKEVLVESCRKLDISNLGSNVILVLN